MSHHENTRNLQALIALSLDEDLGPAGDITSQALFKAGEQGQANLVAREKGCLSGLQLVEPLITAMGHNIKTTPFKTNGENFAIGDIILSLEGPIIGLLELERTLLNFISHLSGIATLTRLFVDEVASTKAKILCTRKTTPGFRLLEKAAVRHGGGYNHRFGLYDGYLIKDNHIAALGSISEAVRHIRARQHHFLTIECEVDTLGQIEDALNENVDIILLDNMAPPILRKAVDLINGRAKTEASGGVTLESALAIAESGVDYISVGGLTHSAPHIDFGLDWAL